MDRACLEIGRVVSVDAARRSVRVRPVQGRESIFESCDRIWLKSTQEKPIVALIAHMSRIRGLFRIEFTPGISRDVVATLAGARVVIPDQMDTPIRDAIVPGLADTLGMRAVLPDGQMLGTVMEVLETPAGGVLRILLEEGRTAALPFIEAAIQNIDGVSRVITITNPELFLVWNDTVPDA